MTLAERQALAVRYLPLAKSMAARFVMRHGLRGQREEFRSAAFEAVWAAATGFDDSLGIDFSVFARKRIWGALADHRHWFTGSRHAGARHVEYSPNNFDLESREDKLLRQLEEVEELEAAVRSLPIVYRPLASLLILGGLRPCEAAASLGLSKGRISRMQAEIARRLQLRRDAA